MRILLILLYLPAQLFAQTYFNLEENPPKVEFGVAVVNATTPHYPGSDQQTQITVPFPAFIYRGDRLRADEDGGLRGRFFHSNRYEVNLSLGGALPVGSDDNDQRAGMPKLDTILEFGPGLIIHLIPKDSEKPYRISLNIPIRYALSTDISDTYGRGLTFNPLLYSFYKYDDHLMFITSFAATWATRRLHDYLYSVEQKYVTPGRSIYNAESGHMLTTLSFGISYKWEDYSLFAGYALHDASNSTNKKSPLFVNKTSHSIGFGFVWWFYESND